MTTVYRNSTFLAFKYDLNTLLRINSLNFFLIPCIDFKKNAKAFKNYGFIPVQKKLLFIVFVINEHLRC